MLSKIKVVELASVLAGPGVGQFFAELGAEVIKVENLQTGGDVTRGWKSSGENTDDRSAYFCSVNWGKQSIAIDLTKTEGRSIVIELISKADLVIASYKPGDARKLGVDYETLSALHPSLIYAQITGYGSDNERVGYDAVIQAESGFMYMNGEPGGSSLKMPVALIDILAAHHLKEGILLAMLEKTQTGKGNLVEVSLLQAAIASLANQANNWLMNDQLPQKQGSAHPNIAPYGDVFKTEDNHEVLLAVGSDKQFQDLCRILNIAAIADNPLFKTNKVRVENRTALKEILAAVISKRRLAEILVKIHHAKIPSGIINDMRQVFEMHRAKDLLLSHEQLTGVRTFITNEFSRQNVSYSSHILPPPHFGQHTEAILSHYLQIEPKTIKNLREKGIIA